MKFLMPLLLLAQNDGSLDQESTQQTLSLMQLILSGDLGGQIIIGLLFVLLLVALYIYFERLSAIKAASKTDPNFMSQIRTFILSGKPEEAKGLCRQHKTPVARLTEKGISRMGHPLEDINSAIENAGRLEVYALEKNVSILATISGAAPMIGFLGTVIGMILTFQAITIFGAGDPKAMAGGISSALVTTVLGLCVAIPTVLLHTAVNGKAQRILHILEEQSAGLIAQKAEG